MRRLLPLLLLLTAAAPAPPPPPSPSPSPSPPEIIVTGRTRGSDASRAEARAFVRHVSPTPVDGQFARWNRPVCPRVTGLSATLAARVEGRIREIAADVGAPVGSAGCKGNAFIAFTADARKLVAALERREPRLLAHMPMAERPAIRTGTVAVRWWYTTLAEGADGNQLAAMPSVAFGPIGSAGPVIPFNDRTRSNEGYRSSMISTGIRSTIAAAVVVVDVPHTTGWRLDAVADYAAFVLLARVRPEPPGGKAATILALFDADPAARPTGLSTGDRAYLTGLYAAPADRTARAQARAIAGTVAHSGRD